MSARFRRPSILAWICFLAAFLTLVGMGTWQVERLQWKEALIASIEEGNQTAPLDTLPPNDPPLFHSVRVRGTFGTQEFHVTPRYFRDMLGYDIFMPFTLTDGRVVMVNRGWVPSAKKDPATRPESRAPKGEVTLIAQIREANQKNTFTPESQPEKNIWFGRDIAHMAEYAELGTIAPYTLDVLGEQVMEPLPVPSDGKVQLRNDHLQYAITWYLIALGALVIFAVFHHIPSPHRGEDGRGA